MSWTAVLQDNWRCAGGEVITEIGTVFNNSELELSVSGQHRMSIAIDPVYEALCRRRKTVVMVILEDNSWYEFRVDNVDRDQSNAFITVDGLPPWYDLNSADLVRETRAGRVITAFDEVLSGEELVTTRILANAAADGLPWFGLGTIAYPDRLRLQYSRQRRAGLLQLYMAALKRGELQVRADGFDGYLIDVVPAIGSEHPVVPVRFGNQLISEQRQTDFSALYTGVRVIGDSPATDAEPASFGDNVYRVHSVTAIGPGGVGPYAAVLRDPSTDVSPVFMDGIFARDPEGVVAPCWLQLATGNTTEILDSRAATGDVVVALEPAVGDRVVIVQSADNMPLDLITWPRAASEAGVAVGDAQVPGGRGERNYVVNPGFDGTASEYSPPVGLQFALIKRNGVSPLIGRINGTKAPGAPLTVAVDGFIPATEARRSMVCEVAGADLTTVGDAFIDSNGDATVVLAAALPATLPAGTQMRSGFGYVLSRGSSNTFGDPDLNITTPGRATAAWMANDELTFTITVPESPTNTSATNRDQRIMTLNLSTPFTRDIAAGTIITWEFSTVVRSLRVAFDYIAGDPGIQLFHPFWTPQLALRGEVPIYGPLGATLTHVLVVTSTHTIVGTPTWNTSAQATVTITPALPINAPVAQTAIRWDRAGAASFVGALTLVADQVATAATFQVLGTPSLVAVIPSGTVLQLVGETLAIAGTTVFDGSGAGTLSLNAANTTTLLDNAEVRLYQNTDWFAEEGGGEHVALIEASINIDELSPGLSDVSPRTQPFRIVVPPGATLQVIVRVPFTFHSPARTNGTQQYAAAKIALVNLDTNTIVAWAGTAPDDAASLSAPANARLPLTWDAGTREWLPLHVALACDTIITQTTRFELRMYATPGLGIATYARTYARWCSVWVAGATDAIPYRHGSPANDLVLTGVQLLARDAQAVDTYALELEDIDEALVRAAGLPAAAATPLFIGSRLLLEDEQRELRLLDMLRRPDRKLSRVTVGRGLPTSSLTLAALAQVTVGGGSR